MAAILVFCGSAKGQNPAFETKMPVLAAKNPENYTQKKRFLMEIGGISK